MSLTKIDNNQVHNFVWCDTLNYKSYAVEKIRGLLVFILGNQLICEMNWTSGPILKHTLRSPVRF